MAGPSASLDIGTEGEIDRQEMLLEELAPVGTAHMPPDIHLEAPPLQGMGPAPEGPVAEPWIAQAGLQELSYGAAEECPPFLDPGGEPQPSAERNLHFPLRATLVLTDLNPQDQGDALMGREIDDQGPWLCCCDNIHGDLEPTLLPLAPFCSVIPWPRKPGPLGNGQ
ncbi:zinc finger protein 449-like [Suricata suricatta]|uniref:zinc finger protein 449-like n=1 Tax=Suricata suricatta TaxID=37032 RepID=UPI0011556667|nr:zinc finger protein 449-like [Suricata suricatta]